MTRFEAGRQPLGVRRLFASASLNVLASVGSAVAGLFATGLMARSLPVDDFGRVMLMVTATNAFAIFEGLRPVVIFRVARRDGDPSALFRATGRVNALMAGVTLACLVIAAIAGARTGLPGAAWLALAATVLVFFGVMQYWSFLDAEDDTIFTGLSRGVAWMLLYSTFAGLAAAQAGVAAFAVALLAMNLGLLLALRTRFVWLGLAARYRQPGADIGVRELLRPAIDNILFNLSAVTINLADRAAVGYGMGAARAGLYAGPSELMLRAGGLIRAAMQVVLPWAARQSEADGHRQRLWLAATTGALVTAGGLCVVVLATRGDLTALLLGERFRQTADLLGLFGIGVLVSALGYTSIAYLNARGDFRTQRRYYGWSALVLVIGVALAARSGELLPVALAFLLARGVDLLLVARVLKECAAADRRRFGVTGAALTAALVAAWFDAPFAALLGLLAVVIVGARLLRPAGGRPA